MRPVRNAAFCVLAPILILAFLFQSYSASRLKSPVFDEPMLIPAGLSYVQTGVVRLYMQHPPLLQELAGLSLVFSGVRGPKTRSEERRVGKEGRSQRGAA